MSITAQQQLMLCKTKYQALLEDVFAKHRQGEERFKQLDYMATVGSTQYSCNVILTESLDKPHKARTAIQTKIHSSGRTNLIYPLESNEDEVEELVLSLQGYAAVCNLPPITTTDQLPRKAIQAKQSITITGLGLPSFEVYSNAILELYTALSQDFPANSIQLWKPTSYEGDLALSFGNRYFSTTQDEEKIPLPSVVDPFNILTSAIPQGRYTSDNEVLYFERLVDPYTQSIKHISINPAAIHVGQLVELQVSFCIQPIGPRRYLFMCKLRSICIFNRTVEEDVNQSWLESIKIPSAVLNKRIKRRVGYAGMDEKEDISAAKFKKLRLDDEEVSMNVQ